MSRRIGLVLAVLMLGMTFSTAVTQNLALAEPTNSPYQAFWSILNREAGLIVKLNSTNNATLAEELIQNSQLGALNAANISAQTWQALEELKASKVKTYYSPKELQEIAQNISKNGLPEETIQTLKKQGWSDEEIKALQDYITKNKDNITTGFNLTEFLENFSQAFIKVAFKYNQYEAWAWKKLLNTNTTSLNLPSITTWKEKTEVPLIWQDFKNFNKTFQNASLKEKLHLLENLKKQIMNISKDKKEELISSTSSTTYAKNPAEYEACSINPSPNPITTDRTEDAKNTAESLIRTLPRIPRNLTNPTQIGFESVTKSRKIMVQGEYVIIMIITRTYRWKLIPLDCSIQETTSTNYELYYWNAFKALEELSNLGVLLKAEEFGNHDPKLNQLEHNITSHLGEYFKTSLRGEYSENFHLKGIYTSEPLTNPKKPIAASQSNTPSSEGYLSAGVSIVKDDVTENYATYRVEVNLKAEDNTISNIKVRVSGTGLSDSTSYDLIHPDDGVITWYSKPSGRIQGSDIVTVNGTVTITYTPNNHDMPTSINSPEEGLDSNTQSKTITIPYSETIRLGRSIDKSKIHFQILPSDSRVKPDNTVTFYVKIINDNNAPVSGSYELNIATPTGTITRRGSISADSNSDSGPIQVATITYASTGTYGYSGTFKFNGYEKQDAGSIIVEDDNGNTGSLKISGVNISPQKPEDGDNVSFTVKVKSTYSTSQNAELELYVDGNLVDSTQGVINANSEETLNLHWIARQGEHSYTIKAYSLVGGEKFTEDEKNGEVTVSSDFNGLSAWLEVYPNSIEAGSDVVVSITIENKKDYAQTWPVELVDTTGNIWWPEPNDSAKTFNYTLSSDGYLKIYAYKKAHILVTIGPLHQNTTLYLKLGGLTMTSASVEVRSTPYLIMTDISCEDLFLHTTATLDYAGTVGCRIGFRNPHDEQVSIQLGESKVLIDFPMSHSSASITDRSATVYMPHETGYMHVKFSASTSDFTAFARYWINGYYNMPVTIRLLIREAMNNNYKTYTYTIRDYIKVKTSDTVYAIVIVDTGSFIAGGEAVKGFITAVKAGKNAKAAWEAFKLLQGFIRGIFKRW
ncbi:hypothetical protein JCM16138_09480 [Thermococcus atlanticus]